MCIGTVFLTSALEGWAVDATSRSLYPRGRECTHCIGGWLAPRAGLVGYGKPPPTEIRSQGRPARSELLYRLNYRGPNSSLKCITEMVGVYCAYCGQYHNLFQAVGYCKEVKSCMALEQQVALKLLRVYFCNVKPSDSVLTCGFQAWTQ
jgi:hypothetical protein